MGLVDKFRKRREEEEKYEEVPEEEELSPSSKNSFISKLKRFHHLFSKTFPIIPVPISLDAGTMKYQIWSPFVSECFGIGRYGVPTLDDVKDLTNTDKLVEKLKSIGWETIKSVMVRGVREQERKMMLIVWRRESKCCC